MSSKFGWSYPAGCSGPPEPPAPSELEEQVLELLENAGMPTERCDKIIKEISDWQVECARAVDAAHESYNPPRRICVNKFVPAEKAIYDAVQAVEALPADPRLTDAVVLLQRARDSVADYVDGVPRRLDAVNGEQKPESLATEADPNELDLPHGEPEMPNCARCGEPYRLHDNEDQRCPDGKGYNGYTYMPVGERPPAIPGARDPKQREWA